MKNKMFLTLMLSLVLFALSGCSEEKEGQTTAEPALVFDNEGEYDLSKYLMPEGNRTNTYKRTTQTDETGTRHYSDAGAESYPVFTFTKQGNRLRQSDSADMLVRVYTTEDVRVRMTVHAEEYNLTHTFARCADLSDKILDLNTTIQKESNQIIFSKKCTLSDSNNTMTIFDNTYRDIIKITCTGSKSTSTEFDSDLFVKKSTLYYQGYFAKHHGFIQESNEYCTKTTRNGEPYKNTKCNKETSTLLTEVTE